MAVTIGRWPAALLAPSEWQWRLAGAALSGGQPISGAPQTADISTGGWWVCEWQVGILRTAEQHSQHRALLGQLTSGVQLIEVPVIDILQPWPGGSGDPANLTADPSGAPIDADPGLGEITVDNIVAQLAAAAYMPAYPAPATPPNQAQIEISAGAALQGGEYFTVIGPSGAPRLHMVTSILSVAGNVSTVTVVPPFRENMAAATAVDFNEPRCTMKVDLASLKDAWPRLTAPFVARPKLIFLEGGFVIPND